MLLETIKDKLTQHPFEPFVIRTSGGQGYTVAGTGLVVLMKSKLFVAEPKSDRSATIAYLHITAVEEPGNGHSHGSSRKPRRGKR